MKGKLWLCLFIFAFGGLNQAARAISNGQSVSLDDPIRLLTVSIYSDDDDCTGTKIAANLILTAHHCKPDKSSRVIFADGSSYKVAHRFTANQKPISSKNEYDVAILKIDGSAPGPVALIADDEATPKDGVTAWIAGYGGKKLTKKNNPLRKMDVTMTDRNYSPSAVIVRAKEGGAVCDGDSGGPGYMQVDGQIVVWGTDSAPLDGKARCSSREVYAKVAALYGWIEKTIADNRLPGVVLEPSAVVAAKQ
jgi:trypsin